MNCQNPGCHCQCEFTISRSGQLVCGEWCRPEVADRAGFCNCGHPGCGSAEEVVMPFGAFVEMAFA